MTNHLGIPLCYAGPPCRGENNMGTEGEVGRGGGARAMSDWRTMNIITVTNNITHFYITSITL